MCSYIFRNKNSSLCNILECHLFLFVPFLLIPFVFFSVLCMINWLFPSFFHLLWSWLLSLLFPHVCLCLSLSPYVRCIQDCRFLMWKRPHLQRLSRAGVRRAGVTVRPAPSSSCPTVVWVSQKYTLNSL